MQKRNNLKDILEGLRIKEGMLEGEIDCVCDEMAENLTFGENVMLRNRLEYAKLHLEKRLLQTRRDVTYQANKTYFSYPAELISNVIARLMTTFEGEEFIAQTAFYDDALIYYVGNPGSNIYDEKKVIVADVPQENININTRIVELYNKDMRCQIVTREFSYVQDFLEKLTEYRFQSGKKNMTDIELFGFLGKYIIEHQREISEKHQAASSRK